MPGLVPGIHALNRESQRKTWMAGTSPAMTESVIQSDRKMPQSLIGSCSCGGPQAFRAHAILVGAGHRQAHVQMHAPAVAPGVATEIGAAARADDAPRFWHRTSVGHHVHTGRKI